MCICILYMYICTYMYIQGGPMKNVPPDKMQFLSNQLRFFYPNFSIYRGMNFQQFLKISLNNFHNFKSYSCLNTKFHFFKFPQINGPIIVISVKYFSQRNCLVTLK